MELHLLPQSIQKKAKRLGQGHGSGRMKTGGRGTKGQKARSKVALRFEGGALPLTKRLPFLRGKEKNKSFREDHLVLNLGLLSVFEKNATVNKESLLKMGILPKKDKNRLVKITGTGEITLPLTIHLPVTSSAREKIEKAGGVIA